MGTRVATFPGCAVITHWLPHTPVQKKICLLLVHKIVWCSLSSSSIQTGVLAVTFHITLLYKKYFKDEIFQRRTIFRWEHFLGCCTRNFASIYCQMNLACDSGHETLFTNMTKMEQRIFYSNSKSKIKFHVPT